MHPVDHLDREPVHGGHRGGGLLRPDRPRGVHGAHRVAGQPAGQLVRLVAAQLVERRTRRAAVQDVGGVGRRASVPGQHEPHVRAPERRSASQRSAAANAAESVPCSGTAGAPTPGAVPFALPARG